MMRIVFGQHRMYKHAHGVSKTMSDSQLNTRSGSYGVNAIKAPDSSERVYYTAELAKAPILLLESKHSIANVFINKGMQVERHAQSCINSGSTNHITQFIKQRKHSAVIIGFPVSGHHIVPHRHLSAMSQSCSDACAAASTKRPSS